MYKFKTIWCPFTQKYFSLHNLVTKETNVPTPITFKTTGEIPKSINMNLSNAIIGIFPIKSSPLKEQAAKWEWIVKSVMDGWSRGTIHWRTIPREANLSESESKISKRLIQSLAKSWQILICPPMITKAKVRETRILRSWKRITTKGLHSSKMINILSILPRLKLGQITLKATNQSMEVQ